MKEEWKDIEGYEGLYQVSTEGRIKSLPKLVGKGNGYWTKESIMVGKVSKQGYHIVGLRKDGKRKHLSVARLVALTFIPNPEKKKTVDHINRVRTDNRVTNLRWATHAEQMVNRKHKRPLTAEERLREKERGIRLRTENLLGISKEDLVEYYINKKNTLVDTAKHFNITYRSLTRILGRLEIRKYNKSI